MVPTPYHGVEHPVPPSSPKRCIIFNPAAKGDKATRFSSFLKSLQKRCDLRPTLHPGHARLMAADAVSEGYDTIVAAGGDGTMNEVVNGIADASGGLENVSLALLPFGTVNVFARELKIPIAHDEAWRVIEAGRTCEIDLPSVTFTNDKGLPEKRHFAQLAGVGPDARAVELLDLNLKRRIGPLAYLAAGFKALAESLPDITAATDRGRSATGKLVIIGNGRYYGGAFNFFPQSSLRDGLIDICVFPDVSMKTLAKAGVGFATNDVAGVAGAAYFQARSVKITADRPAPIQVEGDTIGTTDATFEATPHKVRVVVP